MSSGRTTGISDGEPLVSIIVVNWNGISLLKDCIESILRQTYGNYEIILVDNGSTDDSADYIEKNYPRVRLVRLPENRGFTGGNIEGLKQARGAYIALVNNDVMLAQQWVRAMVAGMGSDPHVGTCASRIVLNGSLRIDSVGNAFTTAGSGVKQGEGEDPSRHSSTAPTWGACAAAVLYRKTMLDDVGFLDDMLYLNYEDTDLDFRSMLAGWKSIYVPEAVAHHKISSTLGQFSDRSVYFFARNSLIVWLKDMPSALLLRYIHHRLFYELATFAYYGLAKGKWLSFIRGKCSALSLFPQILRKRKMVQRSRRVSISYLRSILIPFHKYLFRRMLSAPRRG